MNERVAAPCRGTCGCRAPQRRHARFAAALICVLQTWIAADARLWAQRLSFTRFAAEAGLTGSQVWDVIEDRRGLIWAATTWGFSRFDGETFSTFSLAEGLATPSARTVIEDLEGNIWFGNNSGVFRFDGRSIAAFHRRPGAPNSTVWDAAADGSGRLWFGSETGLVRYERGEFTTFGAADGLASDYVYSLLSARDGALWVGARGGGVARCEPEVDGGLGRCRIFSRADGLGSDVVRALAEDEAGRILVGTRGGGVAIWDGERFRSLGVADGLPSDDVYALLVRRNGNVVVGTAEEGLAVCPTLDSLRCRPLRQENGLPDNGVRALFEDRDGKLWVATEGGLTLLLREDLWSFTVEDGLPNRNVYAVAAGAPGEIWAGTFAGVARLRIDAHGEPSVSAFGRDEGLPAEWVWALQRDRRGAIWVGTEGGLCRMDGARCLPVAGLGELSTAFIIALAEDREGALWVGTSTGFARIRLQADGRVAGVDLFAGSDDVVVRRTYALAADAEGRVWLAHGGALTLFENERFRQIGAEEGLDWSAVRSLGLDGEGRVLVGGWGTIARAEKSPDGALRFRTWENAAGLQNQMVLTLDEIGVGSYLLGTSRGIVVFAPQGGDGEGVVRTRIDGASGAIATEVPHTMAYARDRDGRHWFGFKGGLTVLQGEPLPDSAPPEIFFSRLQTEQGRIFLAPFSPLERGPVGWLQGPVPQLPHGDDSLRVSIRARGFSRRSDLRVQYRLEGVDAGWSEARSELFRDLQKLRAGDHRLLARAAYLGGVWGSPAAMDFRVAAAWWQGPEVPLGAAFLLGGLLVAGLGMRARRARRLKRELERQVAERTDDLARYSAALAEHLQTVDLATDRSRLAERSRRDLFARASHELRTPLTAVLGFSELLERALRERLNPKEQRYLANVRESAEILLRQINELLEHLKLESGRIEIHLDETALGSLLEGVVSLMEGFALHRGIRLELQVPAAMPAVNVDVAKLRQALMNLVSNAVKFSPSGSRVEIAVQLESAQSTPWRQPGYRISVHDDGPGIAADETDAIFEPYQRLKKTGHTTPGTGLGLPIARQFVEMLGGTLTVDSEPGHGATFTIRLPIDPEPMVLLFDSSDAKSFDVQRIQVLVLDADRERFAMLVRALSEEEFLAVRVDDAQALAKMLGSLRPRAIVTPFDPVIDGSWAGVAPALELARNAGLPVIVLPTIGGRALALPFASLIDAGGEEAAVRRMLRAAGVSAQRTGRRPLVLIAAERELGAALGSLLSAAGCDHFRVEEAEPVRAAMSEAQPDAIATDLRHALALAATIAALGNSEEPQGAWLLADAEVEPEADFNRLAEEIVGAGVELESVLAPALKMLLDRSRGLPAPS